MITSPCRKLSAADAAQESLQFAHGGRGNAEGPARSNAEGPALPVPDAELMSEKSPLVR
jgi:hypothetical protein